MQEVLKMENENYDRQTRAALLTINNPEKYGMTHDNIINIMHTKFKHLQYWCMCDEQGSCYHTHVYFLLKKKKRWSAIQKAFPHSHIEEAKSTPQQCRDYLLKAGDKFKDKAETSIEGTFYEEGEIPPAVLSMDKSELLLSIQDMIDQGMNPEEIMSQSILLRQYDALIRKAFFAKRFAETPPLREITVVWHLGASGSGKTYSYVRLCEQYGSDKGEIPPAVLSMDKSELLLSIQDMIDQGMNPEEIMSQSILLRQYDALIRKAFFAKRFAETPPLREITVVWHLGASGSGKTYSYVRLCEQYGSDNVYFASDYANGCSAMLDTYSAEPILYCDEVKPDSFKYGYLLQLLQGYRTPIHARYSNVFSLWDQVHLSSIFTPREIYEEMVSITNRSTDSFEQLARRITNYVYHWKTKDGEYHTYEQDAKDFVSYEDIKDKAEKTLFSPLEGDSPFDK